MAYDGFNQLAQTGALFSSFTNPIKRDITTVNGYQEAKDYKLFRGERMMFLDSNSDILYLKSCDDLGKYTLKVYECKDVTHNFEEQNTPASISQSQFNDLNAKIEKLTQLLGVKNELNAREQPELDFSGNSVCKSTETNKPESRNDSSKSSK